VIFGRRNAKYFVSAEISGSLSCSAEIIKLPLFTRKGLVVLPKGSVWPLPRHLFVRTHFLPHVKNFCLAGDAQGLGCTCGFSTTYPQSWSPVCPALWHLS